jgi:recombination protein RecT
MSGNGNLRDKVAAQRAGSNGGSGNGTGAEVERVSSLKQQIEKMTAEYQLAMPKGMEATQLVRDAITCLRNIRHLDACDPNSVLGALMTCAQLGLRPAVLGHAWPLPYWDYKDKCYKAQLVIGYKGYVELGYRSGKISAITSRVVRHGEKFSLTYHEDRDELFHEPAVDGIPGDIRCFYSTARLTNGGYTVTEPYSIARMQAHRDEHAPRNREQKIVGPWVDNFPEMGQKTMVLVNYKLLPKSAEMAIAMEADEGIRLDLSPSANAAEVTRRPVVPGTVEPADPPASSTQQRSAQEEASLRDEARRAAEEAQAAGNGGEG